MEATGEGEVQVPAPEVPLSEAVAAEEPRNDEKPIKEKKLRAPREKKPRKPKAASHPPYFQMIKEALLSLSDKNGSSPYAIAKFMEEKHKAVLPGNFRKILALQLKNSTARGKLTKVKASYKLSEAGKKIKDTSKVAKANAERRTEQSKRRSMKKTDTARKPAKKMATKKAKKSTLAKPKQPKSIKSPAAKRAKKAAA